MRLLAISGRPRGAPRVFHTRTSRNRREADRRSRIAGGDSDATADLHARTGETGRRPVSPAKGGVGGDGSRRDDLEVVPDHSFSRRARRDQGVRRGRGRRPARTARRWRGRRPGSAGERLVVNWPSMTTSSSTTSAPALRRSVRTPGARTSCAAPAPRRPRRVSTGRGRWRRPAYRCLRTPRRISRHRCSCAAGPG